MTLIAVIFAGVFIAQAAGGWQVAGMPTVINVDGTGRGNPDD